MTGIAPGQPEYRILIVEDQVENWMLLRRLLEGVGFPVRVAGNGAEGITMFQSWRPHLILMDIRMPVMDGLEATKRIRALESGKVVKIVALTASVFKEERDNVMAAGMDDFIRKPYRFEEIFDCLTRHLGVQFTEEKTTETSPAEPELPLHPGMFLALPLEMKKELTDALVSLDITRIDEAIARITGIDPVLGRILTHHTERFDYTAILQVLQDGSSRTIGDSP